MSRAGLPPRLALWLLAKRLPDRWREFVIGDLEEEFAARSSRAPVAARVWLWGQTLRCLILPLPVDWDASTMDKPHRPNLATEFVSDLRFAARALKRAPGFALLAVGIMALGIGANTAVFSVVNGVLLKPLPYPDANRIVALRTVFQAGGTQPQVSIANYRDWRAQSSSFEAMATYRGGNEAPVSSGTTAEYTRAASVDVDFFRVLGVQPILGRTFTAEENVPGTASVVIISHSYWQSRFGGDPRVLERTVRAGLMPRSIVGVMPPGFQFPGETDVWAPQTTSSTSRTGHNFLAFGRLKPDVSVDRARSELSTIAAGLERQYPDSNKGRGVTAVALQDELVGDVRLTLYLVWGVVGVVLLIACANTATLMLGKATARAREMAVRTALGANRGRIVRQLITESALVALIAGVAGLVLAFWGSQALVALSPSAAVRRVSTGLDVGVFAFTLAVSLATSLFFGLIPALHASRVDLIDAFKQGARSVGGGRMARTRGLLVVVEVALAVVLLTGAGLLIKSLVALHGADLGFQPDNVLVVRATGVRARADNDLYFDQLMKRVSLLPGVTAVGATSIPPGDWANAGTGTHSIDHPPAPGDRSRSVSTLMTIIAPGSFAALGVPLKSGRDFDDGDTGDRALVAIVNEALVRASLGGREPIGRTIHCFFDRPDSMTIVGVVGDVRQRNPGVPAVPECYMPYRQHSYNNATLNVLVRTAGAPTTMVGSVRQAAAEVSPDVPLAFTTMADNLSRTVEDSKFRALLFGMFAAFAVCLAMAGVYGVLAYAVTARSKEIGLRMALGASRTSVLRLILGQGLALVAVGLAVGLVGAGAAARLLETVLFEVKPIDAGVYAAVAVVLALVALAAGFVPARRASVVDPAVVLKGE